MEFRSAAPFSPWTEMTLTLHSPADNGRVNCNGVVISCTGSKHAGYRVSMVFTSLTKQAQARLSTMAEMQAANAGKSAAAKAFPFVLSFIAELIIAKQRNGPTGKVLVRFASSCTRFDNLAPGDYPEADGDD